MDLAALTALVSALGGFGPVALTVLLIGVILLTPAVLSIIFQGKFLKQMLDQMDRTVEKLGESFDHLNKTVEGIREDLKALPLIANRLDGVESKLEAHLKACEAKPRVRSIRDV